MFSKILTFGIGALALVQGALAIAPGRYIIRNREMGTLVSIGGGQPLSLSRSPFPAPVGQWNVEKSGQDEYTIINDDVAVLAYENTLFAGNRIDNFSIEDAGNDLLVIRATDSNRVWTAANDDATVHLEDDEGSNSQRWVFVPL
ncbi:hypothetical protein DFH08DRAFT_937547 [Mycena albidolilacea]|uniref:Ricin B lectin domain-containing protein n=1 Tax=Mycena albidolilacea TaxID=1033008 RepID=A0AAD7EPL2_9AGAR|nr:hypothetical protein DFH08DRAFT_937547 [Mycena albidolilacea]